MIMINLVIFIICMYSTDLGPTASCPNYGQMELCKQDTYVERNCLSSALIDKA